MSETRVDERGAERCMRVKTGAVENIKGDPSKGYHQAKVYCNKPMLMSVALKRKICPDCEKPPGEGFPEPRITNAGGVVLTVKEMEECGLKPDGTRIDGKEIKKATAPIEAQPQAVEAKVEVKKDEVTLIVPLSELAAAEDVPSYLIRKVIEGFGSLPTPTYAESKRVMKLEEKLEALLQG